MMEQTILQTIQKYRLLCEGDNVIVAFSGGADSMALFHFLFKHAKTWRVTLFAAHFDHGLRAAESSRDALFVKRVCAGYGVPLFMETANMRSLSRPQGVGTEEWARNLRYAFFEKLALHHSAKIATAHTLSDNAETVLFHAIRGAGPHGLSGIPVSRDVFIRPLLQVNRAAVERYCAENVLEFVVDSTNAHLQYSRNRIRLQALPALSRAHPAAEVALGRLAEDMREIDLYLRKQAEGLLSQTRRVEGHDAAGLLQAAKPVRLTALALLAGSAASRRQLEGMELVLRGELGALQLSENVVVHLKSDVLYCKVLESAKPFQKYEIPLREGEICLPNGFCLAVEVAKLSENAHFTVETEETCCTFVADYDKLFKYCVFRTRRPADCFAPAGRGITKTIRKWMNEEKIPVNIRCALPLLCQENRVLWVWGKGFCDGVAVDEKTLRVVCIRQIKSGI